MNLNVNKKEVTNMYLNYTHGAYLNELSTGIRTALENGNLNSCKTVIDRERRTLFKKQEKNKYTTSDKAYEFCLKKISELLSGNPTFHDVESLFQTISEFARKRIQIVFFVEEPSCWASMESVYKAALKDKNIDSKLVYLKFSHPNADVNEDYLQYYKQLGYCVISHDEYCITDESPDIAIMIKPYSGVPDGFHPSDIIEYVPRVIYIPYGMEATTDLIKFGFQYYLQYKAWRHCAYGNIVKEFGTRYGYRNGENIVVWGHPKADYVASMGSTRSNIPDEWKRKINGRKTILWTPHHLVNENDEGTGTFLILGKKILDIMEVKHEIAFIFRPHPLLIGNLVNSGKYTEKEIEDLYNRIEKSENIIWDNSEQYYNAFCASDAIITDGTTFCIEYLYTKKPIMLTPRNMTGFYSYEDMLESYYIAKDISDFENFIELIKDGRDPLKEKRYKFYNKLFYIPEGITVGENIIQNVEKDLNKEIKDFMLQDTQQVQPHNKNEYPLFSILVLCYKNMTLLFSMLDSIFEQDYPNIELIVSDDASDDFDIEMVTNYVEMNKNENITNFHVLKNEKNLATVRHINEAFKKVSGEYLVYTAADDRFNYMTVISDYVKSFNTYPEKKWIVARCNMTSADYKKSLYLYPTDADLPYFQEGDAIKLFSRWSRRGMALPCCMAFRKSAIESFGGFDLDYKYLEDWPLDLKLLRNGFAPIFLEKVTAIHSSGGVTNSNERYGKNVRREFYEDKNLIFKKEVNPYKHLMTSEDKKCLKQYMKEIMKRQYFFNIDFPETGIIKRIGMCIVKPVRGWWLFERFFMKNIYHHRMWKLLAAAGVSLVVSTYFFIVSVVVAESAYVSKLFGIIGSMFIIGFVLLLISGITGFILKKHFRAKYWLRKRLVN